MLSLPPRRLRREQMDDAPPGGARDSLRDLRVLNRWFGGHATLQTLLRRQVRQAGSESYTVLDIGAASGDMGGVIRRWLPQATVISADYRLDHLEDNPGPGVVADAFALPFPEQSFDFVFCSLFLHHFEDRDVVRLFASFGALARRGVLVVDLERHPLAAQFVPWTKALLGWHPITVFDAPASVEAAFTPGELQSLAQQAGLQQVVVRRHLPWFRLSLWATP